MSDAPPDDCQYAYCTTAPTGALEFIFGVRWLCSTHYATMVTAWNGDGPDVVEPAAEAGGS